MDINLGRVTMKTKNISQSRKIFFPLFILLTLCTNKCFAATYPLDFNSKPQYPITLQSGQQGEYFYVLKNNTGATLPLQFSLSDPAHFQIGSTHNSCGASISPGATCQFPLVVTAPTTTSNEDLRADLKINYQGSYPLDDNSINFVIKPTPAPGKLTIQASTANRHLQYQALYVQNLSSTAGIIKSVNISSNLDGLVKECKSGDTTCAYQSTCKVNSAIAPGDTCYLWFKSMASKQGALGFGEVIGSVTVSDGNTDHMDYVKYDMNLFAGGSFNPSPSAHIARWNGNAWYPLGTGTNSTVQAIAIYKGDLYAGGNFSAAGGTVVNHIAYWTGANWNTIPPRPGLNSVVYRFLVANNKLYIGGNFRDAGGIGNADRVATWDGNSWQSLSPGLNNRVYALAMFDNKLYTGGTFAKTNDGTTLNNVGSWDGNTWQALTSGGTGVNNPVQALTVYNDTLILGGKFTTVGGIANANRIVVWNGGAWSALGSGINNNTVNALASDGNKLYVGGSFASIDGNSNMKEIAMWNGSAWTAIGSGLNNTVYSLDVYDGNLIAGGNFRNAGGIADADRIAIWDGSQWHALAGGVGGTVYALAVGSSLELM